MANAFYVKGKEKILSGAINFISDTIKVMLVKSTYPQNLATDEFISTVVPYRLGTDQTLAAKSVTGGMLDAGDVTWTSVTAGDTTEGVVLYKYTGDEATSPVLAYIDDITGFPFNTSGGNVMAEWDNGAYKIFSL